MKYLSKILYILIFLVMVTSPYAGHTYAEYAREATGSDMARISKFGITATATCDAFSVSYLGASSTSGVVAESANGEDKVFAPGLSGNLCEYHISGMTEVRTLVTRTAVIEMNDQWTNDEGTFYCPITFTIGNKTFNGLDYSDKETLIADLKNEMETGNGAYGSNYDFVNASTAAPHNRTVTWSWPYEGATGSQISQTEENDNSLGNKTTKPTLSISFDLTVEQVD